MLNIAYPITVSFLLYCMIVVENYIIIDQVPLFILLGWEFYIDFKKCDIDIISVLCVAELG